MRLFSLAALGTTILAAWATAAPAADFGGIDLKDRSVAVYLEPGDGAKSGTADRRAAFVLDAKDAAKSYALRIHGSTDPVTIAVNGKAVEGDPIVGDDSLWFMVDARFFAEGPNTLTVTPDGAKRTDDSEILLFSLDDDFEADHFGLVAKAAIQKVQPALDPSQEIMDVRHLDLAITLNMAAATIPAAVATLTIRSLDNSLSVCALDLNDNGGALVVSAVDSGPATAALPFTHNGTQERLFITLPAAVPAGNDFTVRVTYSGTPLSGRGYRRTTHSGTPLIYTNSQPYDARTWWPGKDIPADKHTADLHITVPDTVIDGFPLTPVSNGTLVSTIDNGNGTKTFNWSESYDVASYLVSITCSNYREAPSVYTALDNVTTMNIRHFFHPESWAAESPQAADTPIVMKYLAETFGEYPFLTEKYATATWGLTFGMEHQTVSSMPNLEHQNPFTRRAIHELAHMWFGDMVGYATYDHLWLAEGWATYCEALFYGDRDGMAAYHSYVNAWSTSDARAIVSSSQDAFDSATNATAYRKGAWVLHMLRHVIGDTAFFQGTRNYLSDPDLKYGTAYSQDFADHISAAAGENMDWFFNQWLYRTARPAYSWGWLPRTEGADTIVDVIVSQTQAGGAYRMPVDVRVTFADTTTQTYIVETDQLAQTFSLNVGARSVTDVTWDPDNWVLDNATEVSIGGAPTGAPVLSSVVGDTAGGSIAIAWTSSGESGIAGYRVEASADGATGWSPIADESTLGPATTAYIHTGLSAPIARYYRVSAARSGLGGPASDVYGARIAATSPKVLVVDAYDRWDTQSVNPSGANHAFAAQHGRAIAAFGAPFDTCANEVAGIGVPFAGYPVVDWFCGDESTTDEAYSGAEQARVAAYLDGGGKLFSSGNEIGWDLDRPTGPSTADRAFYNNYLKTNYVADDSNVYTATGTGSAFLDDVYTYGSGDAAYQPQFPDVIEAAGGSLAALGYAPGVIAGVQYFGRFGTGNEATPGAVISIGFAFELLSSEAERELMMRRVLSAFTPPAGIGDYFLVN